MDIDKGLILKGPGEKVSGMSFAVKSLILTGAIVSLVSFCGLIYLFPANVRECIFGNPLGSTHAWKGRFGSTGT
jgi:hypothetical protein